MCRKTSELNGGGDDGTTQTSQEAFSLPWINCWGQSKKLHGAAKDNKC